MGHNISNALFAYLHDD